MLARIVGDGAVHMGNFGVELVQLLLGRCDGSRGPGWVEGRDARRDRLDGVLELLHTIALIRQQRDAERSNAFGKFVLQHGQG